MAAAWPLHARLYAEGVALGVGAQLAAPRRPVRRRAASVRRGQAVGVCRRAVNGDDAPPGQAEGRDAEGLTWPSA
jgi:hypothetical protein